MRSEKFTQSEKKAKLALKAAGIGAWRWDPQSKKSFHDEGINTILGLGQFSREVEENEFYEFIHPEDKERHRDFVKSVFREKKPFKCEFRIVRPDGTVRWVVDQGKPLVKQNGQIELVTGVLIDITEIKETQIELEHKKEQLAWGNSVVKLKRMNSMSLFIRKIKKDTGIL